MVCYCLDLRSESKLAKFLSHKIVCFIVGVIQLVMWLGALLAFITQPGPLKEKIQNSDSGAIAFAVILVLVCIAFSVLLLVGVFKDKRRFLEAYLIFLMVVIVLFVISIIVNIFTQPGKFGLSGFLSSIITILLNILTYFVVRNYYLAFISKPENPSILP